MLLIESCYFKGLEADGGNYEILESAGVGGTALRLRGVFARRDQINDNHREYPKRVWDKVLREGSEPTNRIKIRNFYGELDHPDDGRTLLKRTSHLVTELKYGPDNTIIGTAEILPTDSGRCLRGLAEAKALFGISSRGDGDVTEENGRFVVQDNFNLQAFDFVHNPSTAGAYPRLMQESRKNGDVLMDLLEEYRRLERSVLELASLKPKEVPLELRPIVEKQAEETMLKLSKIIEAAGEHRPLFMGLLSELQGTRRGLIFRDGATTMVEAAAPGVKAPTLAEHDEVTLPLLDKLLAANKTAKPGETGKVEALPAEVTPSSVPSIPGAPKTFPESKEQKEEGKMVAENKRTVVPKSLRAIMREAEDEITANTDENDPDKVAEQVAAKCESRLIAKTRRIMEADGLMPSVYEPKQSQGMMELPEEDEPVTKPFPPKVEADNDMVDIPPPPAAMGDDDGDEEPQDDEGQPLPPMEAKLVKSLRTLIRENRRMRYEKKVMEAIAAKAIAKLTRKVQEARRTQKTAASVSVIEANGQKIPVKQAGAVIESLVKKYKTLKESTGTGTASENTNNVTEAAGAVDDNTLTFSRPTNVAKLNESLRSRTAINESIMDRQADMAGALAARCGRN